LCSRVFGVAANTCCCRSVEEFSPVPTGCTNFILYTDISVSKGTGRRIEFLEKVKKNAFPTTTPNPTRMLTQLVWFLILLFMYGLFNDALKLSEYIA